jgi:hypothetical protein
MSSLQELHVAQYIQKVLSHVVSFKCNVKCLGELWVTLSTLCMCLKMATTHLPAWLSLY